MDSRSRALVAVAVLAATLAAGPAARAATVSVSDETEEEGTLVSYSLDAAPGEANRVTVETRPASGMRRTVVFRDAGAPLTAGAGCTAGPAGEVVCTGDFGDFANSVDVYARDGDDVVDAGAVALRGFTVFVDGGDGSDVVTGSRTRVNALFGDFTNADVGADALTGGSRDDFLQGGPGADALEGGGGSDTSTFRDERRRVRVDLTAGFALAADGTRDSLSSIEEVEGGDGGDVLRGSAAPNVLKGGAGADELVGRGGADELLGEDGPDHLDGGLGGDRLAGGRGADRLDGGAGGDRLDGGGGLDRTFAGPGADRVRSVDGKAETVGCGPQRDRLVADRLDRALGCETVVRG